MTPACILVCEDEPSLRNDLQEELRDSGYRVLSASDGVEAVEVLCRERPDLIVCDIFMPRMDGRALLQRVRTDRPDLDSVPFLFLTALGDAAEIVKGKLSGADDYLVKPVDYAFLRATIAAQLRQVSRLRSDFEAEIAAVRSRITDWQVAGTAALNHFPFGVLLLDEDRTILRLNAVAAEALGGDTEAVQLGQRFGWRRDLRLLSDLLDRALTGDLPEAEPIRVEGDGTHGDLVLSVSSLFPRTGGKARAMVFIVDPHRRRIPRPDQLARAFGLTPAEARTAQFLAQGMRLQDIAREIGVSTTTVTFHLKNLFAKTGTNRQSDLVALILSLSPLFPL